MDNSASIILGIVQGLTEFLPISSSGHLVLFQVLLSKKQIPLIFDISLHLGTLFAIFLYFSEDIKKIMLGALHLIKKRGKGPISHDEKMVIWIVISNIPTAIIGFAFKDPIEAMFASVKATGLMLVVTGVFLSLNFILSERYTRREEVGVFKALIIGTAQGFALIPGISRSGITIITALALGIRRELAGRFSFLISVPAIMGAMGLEIIQGGAWGLSFITLLLGFLVSMAVGIVALRILMNILKKGSLHLFSPYCILLGLLILFIR